MSQGQDQVRAALEICQDVSERVSGLVTLDETWRAESARRCADVQERLDAVMGTFFLRTKLSVPFSARCERAAKALQEMTVGLEENSDEQVQEGFDSALGAMEKAAKRLADRSTMRGMAIT